MQEEAVEIIYTFFIWGIIIVGPWRIFALAKQLRSHSVLRTGEEEKKSGTLGGGRIIYNKIFIVFWAIIWVLMFYGSFMEPEIIVVRRESIDLAKISSPVRVALVSDLHYGPWKKTDFAVKTVNKIKELKPDLIFIAGDVISDGDQDLASLKPWKELAKITPVYAVLGNHEFGAHHSDWPNPNFDLAEKSRQTLKNSGIKLLENEAAKIKINNEIFYLIGLGDLWVRQLDVGRALNKITKDLPKIVLVHNPDAVFEIIQYQKNQTQSSNGDRLYTIDLLLAGHTHGGQIRLPILGPIGIIPTMLGQKYDKGWFDFNGIKMFITSGLGETTARPRLFNPPEIVLLTIY